MQFWQLKKTQYHLVIVWFKVHLAVELGKYIDACVHDGVRKTCIVTLHNYVITMVFLMNTVLCHL